MVDTIDADSADPDVKGKAVFTSPPMASHVMERLAQWRTSLGPLFHEDACARAAVHLLSVDAVLDAAAQL